MKGFYHLIVVATAVALLSVAPSSAESSCSKSVTMYNAWWCPYCRQVRVILARHHIRYSILDASSSRVQAIMLRRFGETRRGSHSWPRVTLGNDPATSALTRDATTRISSPSS
jgi:glutaredoxin